MIRPYPWGRLPRLERRDIGMLRALTLRSCVAVGGVRRRRRTGSETAGGVVEARSGVQDVSVVTRTPRWCTSSVLESFVGVGGTLLVVLRRGVHTTAHVAIPGSLVRTCAYLMDPHGLGDMPASRPSTRSERGHAAAVCADMLSRHGYDDVLVDVSPMSGADLVNRLEEHEVRFVVPRSVSVRHERYVAYLLLSEETGRDIERVCSAESLLAERGSRLSGVRYSVPVVCEGGLTSRDECDSVEVGDVLITESHLGDARLVVNNGHVVAAVAESRRELAITRPYIRRIDVSEQLLVDTDVQISCVIGRVSLSARRLLELEPGQVVALDTPIGGPVDILCGDRVVARGELVDVDGDIGVRITSVIRTIE